MAKRIDLKLCFENFVGMPSLAWYDLCDWKCCDEKLYGDVLLNNVRIIMIE